MEISTTTTTITTTVQSLLSHNVSYYPTTALHQLQMLLPLLTSLRLKYWQ